MARKARTYRKANKAEEQQQLEHAAPEAAAAIVEKVALGDKFFKVSELAHALGLKPATVQALVDRLQRRYQPVVAEIRKVTTGDILALAEERLQMALEYMTDVKLAEASGRDLAVIVGILTEKRALLRGEPTQIVSNADRANLMELLPELLKEAQRRGMVVDLNPSEYAETVKGGARIIADAGRTYQRAVGRPVHEGRG